ncbi:polyprenyl diphosphate synthase [Sutterella sp.]|uniref:polyprenyl diphosphate synthase n=1 Tax=Sutterella sp. TaxID=1981025 RepID=UPI0026E10E5E|nr:polyprenyl diphosphate synthase [Sutterella sp.]MDO5530869.1 polyprenyl diphosphate synthase [Sutterella sp.]
MSKKPALPRHIAIIMDGNGRWAKSRFMPRVEGHRKGVLALERVVKHAAERGIAALTVFAFSSENWRRPAAEVTALMKLFAAGLDRWEQPLADAGVRLRVIGDRTAFSETLNAAIDRTEAATAAGRSMQFNIAANYGGRWDMLQAAQAAAAAGELTLEGIEKRLCARDDGPVDLMIRTGGERRISNFLLWQAAYSELYFTDTLWPDFDGASLDDAIDWYVGRERRFGMTSEQVTSIG